MGRIYSVSTAAVAVTTAIDVAELVAAAGKPFILHEVVLGQYSDAGDAAAEVLSVLIKRGIGYTSGSGGSTPTPAKMQTRDTAAGGRVTIAEFSYNASNTMKEMAFGNGNSIGYVYDKMDRVDKLVITDKAGNELSKYDYDYDAAGNLVKEKPGAMGKDFCDLLRYCAMACPGYVSTAPPKQTKEYGVEARD